jgi:hypothetical protein
VKRQKTKSREDKKGKRLIENKPGKEGDWLLEKNPKTRE